jgi:hypothetical protein
MGEIKLFGSDNQTKHVFLLPASYRINLVFGLIKQGLDAASTPRHRIP